jgi:hypothetical protein
MGGTHAQGSRRREIAAGASILITTTTGDLRLGGSPNLLTSLPPLLLRSVGCPCDHGSAIGVAVLSGLVPIPVEADSLAFIHKFSRPRSQEGVLLAIYGHHVLMPRPFVTSSAWWSVFVLEKDSIFSDFCLFDPQFLPLPDTSGTIWWYMHDAVEYLPITLAIFPKQAELRET